MERFFSEPIKTVKPSKIEERCSDCHIVLGSATGKIELQKDGKTSLYCRKCGKKHLPASREPLFRLREEEDES